MARGGARAGAGRKKGSKSLMNIRSMIKDKNVKFALSKMLELIAGVEVQQETKDGPRIYSLPPNQKSIDTLLAYAGGKPVQAIDVKTDKPILIDFSGLTSEEIKKLTGK